MHYFKCETFTSSSWVLLSMLREEEIVLKSKPCQIKWKKENKRKKTKKHQTKIIQTTAGSGFCPGNNSSMGTHFYFGLKITDL